MNDFEIATLKENNREITAEFKDLDPEKLAEKCRTDAKSILGGANGDTRIEKDAMNSLVACLKDAATAKLKEEEDELEFQFDLRDSTAFAIENFTCTDTSLESSPDVDQQEWTSEKDGVTRKVHVKLERAASRIHVIANFAYPEECDAMAETAAPRLHVASVADGKGGIEFSNSRKAKQAGIHPQWQHEKEGDLVTRLSRRVYDYTNHALGLNVSEHGQEPLMSIQYFGRGHNDTEPDRYTPHCDGVCTGAPHKSGSRMATVVIYWYGFRFYWWCFDIKPKAFFAHSLFYSHSIVFSLLALFQNVADTQISELQMCMSSLNQVVRFSLAISTQKRT